MTAERQPTTPKAGGTGKPKGKKAAKAAKREPAGGGKAGGPRESPGGASGAGGNEGETRTKPDGFHTRQTHGRRGLRRFTLVVRPPLPGAGVKPTAPSGFTVHGRRPNLAPESAYEKQLVLASQDNENLADLLWADARFAVDEAAEHALFFSMMMPPELAAEQKRQAQAFHERYTRLWQHLDARGPPAESELRSYVRSIQEETQPFLDFTDELHHGQLTGKLQSLASPMFFDHTRKETDRALVRLEQIAGGQAAPDRDEAIRFGAAVMEEHGRMLAQLLDPDEMEVIEKALSESKRFRAYLPEASTPGLDEVTSAAEGILDFKTDLARKVESARVRSALNPILADHMRREALKLIDELQRCKD